jgi:hypothetical protein
MKAKIKVKNRFTFPTYTVMIGNEVIQGFYSRAEAVVFRNDLNSKIIELIN